MIPRSSLCNAFSRLQQLLAAAVAKSFVGTVQHDQRAQHIVQLACSLLAPCRQDAAITAHHQNITPSHPDHTLHPERLCHCSPGPSC
jgi:hypothetical protein